MGDVRQFCRARTRTLVLLSTLDRAAENLAAGIGKNLALPLECPNPGLLAPSPTRAARHNGDEKKMNSRSLFLWLQALRGRLVLPPGDLLRDVAYRRIFSSIMLSSIGGQVSMLALPLTAAVLLHASPTQMGLLTAFEIAPFVLLSLPTGVWLDRVRKLPVYIVGEATMAGVLVSVPMAWWLGWLGMPWMYAVGFVLGCVHVVAGSAAQIVLTQVVPRERLVEAHAKNALASSGADVAGPGFAGALIKILGAPVALLVDAFMILCSVAVLRGLKVREVLNQRSDARFMPELKAGVAFVRGTPLLVAMALTVGLWQMCHHAAAVVQILYATRTLGLS